MAVNVFDRAESLAFLRGRTNDSIGEVDADRLAEELGDLPLALEQAGALLFERGMSASEYLRLLAERPGQLLSQGRPAEYPVPLTAAWSVSMANLAGLLPEAVDLLRVCAFLGPGPFRRDLFHRAPEGLSPELTSLINDPIRLSRAVGEFSSHGLARLDISHRTIEVHRLTQRLIREELSPEEHGRLRHVASLLLAAHGSAAADDAGRTGGAFSDVS
ncbi:DUF7779 domain-containing protein [Actinoallomurus acaciae]|uniref:DUF7779 domain-containing protein n=1 Tax=Actinoallomurus acaciae TaxID=502577 RepID=A0ABV5YG99_9ACTN